MHLDSANAFCYLLVNNFNTIVNERNSAVCVEMRCVLCIMQWKFKETLFMEKWNGFADKVLDGGTLSLDEAHEILSCPDTDVLSLLSAAYKVRHKYFQNRVKMNFLLNIKSGICQEDCHYCSQSKISDAPIPKYPLMDVNTMLEAAGRAVKVKAKRFCMVASGRGPTDEDVDEVADAVRKVKQKYPELEICVCMGLLDEEKGKKLKDAGVNAYNHNLNTSEEHYDKICSTHDYHDRVKTVEAVKNAELSSCSGCLFGMGESEKDIVDVAFSLRAIHVDSLPINFLIPIKGTPLSNVYELTPYSCLKILCLFRFVHPDTEIRVAGGREVHLRSLQPLALYAANSIFVGDYLTTKGELPAQDLQMLKDMGFVLEGHAEEAAETSASELHVELLKPKDGQRVKKPASAIHVER